MTPKHFYPGKAIMVFDPRLWEKNGGDSKTDSFMRRAVIEKVYPEAESGAVRIGAHNIDKRFTVYLLDVRFEHDNRLSKGHFANMTEEIL